MVKADVTLPPRRCVLTTFVGIMRSAVNADEGQYLIYVLMLVHRNH